MYLLNSSAKICLLGILLNCKLLCAQFGELPAKDLFSAQIHEVIGESSIAFFSEWIPQVDSAEFKFSSVESDSTKYLHTFAIADIASLQLEDSAEAQAAKIAFWWVKLDKAPQVPVENNYEHLIELKLWTNNASLAALYQKHGMNCELANIDTRYTDNTSSIELKSTDAHFQLSLKELGTTPIEVKYDLPIFMTIWPFSRDLNFYQLYTFYGHKVQYANEVDLKIINTEETDFTKILKAAYLNSQIWGNLQSNWKARFALYSRHK